MKYDFDNLHIEIDDAASELKLEPFDALEIWHIGIEQWRKRTEPVVEADAQKQCRCYKFYKHQNSYSFCPDCGRDLRTA